MVAMTSPNSRPTPRACSSTTKTKSLRCTSPIHNNRYHPSSQVAGHSKLRSWSTAPRKAQMASKSRPRRDLESLSSRAARTCRTNWRWWLTCAIKARVTRVSRSSPTSRPRARFKFKNQWGRRHKTCRWTWLGRCSSSRTSQLDRARMLVLETRVRKVSFRQDSEWASPDWKYERPLYLISKTINQFIFKSGGKRSSLIELQWTDMRRKNERKKDWSSIVISIISQDIQWMIHTIDRVIN